MRAALYVRVSTEDQVAGTSLETQEASCRAWCKSNGFGVARVFIERGESAKTADRTEFQAMLRWCAANKETVQRVVVWKFDRFARSTYDFAVSRGLLATYDIQLVSVTEPTSDDPAGKMLQSMLAAIAEFDNAVRAERTVTAMRSLQERGYWTHRAPVGYRIARVDGKPALDPDPEYGPAIRAAFEAVAAGDHPATVWRQAKANGVRVSRTRFYAMLTDPLYCGEVRTKLTRGAAYRGTWTPLIDSGLFNRVQGVLRRGIVREARGVEDFPLRGLIVCHVCGHRLTASYSRGRGGKVYGYYHCLAGHVRLASAKAESMVEARISAQVALYLPTMALFRAMVMDEVMFEAANAEATEGARRAEVTRLEARQRRLLDALTNGTINESAYRAKADQLRADMALAQIEHMETAVGAVEAEALVDTASAILRDLPGSWSRRDAAGRRALAEAIFIDGIPTDGTADVRTVFGEIGEYCDQESGMASQRGEIWKHLRRLIAA